MHHVIEPAILYVGTPVVLVGTTHEDGTPNIAPMSSAWWLGWSCMLGFDASSKTPENLARTGECVLNLPSSEMVAQVDRLAMLTGSSKLPPHKVAMGYRHEPDKFAAAGLTPKRDDTVNAPRVLECPLQLEAVVDNIRPFAENDPRLLIPVVMVEVRIKRVHADERILMAGHRDRIDPDKWRPLIMNFREFFDLGSRVHASRLAEFPEEAFAPPEFRAEV